MASFLNNIRGKSSEDSIPQDDSDFADFSGNAPPIVADTSPPPAGRASSGGLSGPTPAPGKPYTKWYNLHERYTLDDFRVEGYILSVVAVLLIFHVIGSRRNRSKARAWARAHAPVLRSEFSSVGFSGVPAPAETQQADDGSALVREKSLFEFESYATGRQNVAFIDVNLTLKKRFHPILSGVEYVLGTFFDLVTPPKDSLEAVVYPFDGREAKTVPTIPGSEPKFEKSTYDNFVWGIVNKNCMQAVRDERYDASITFTKDNAKLPVWLTVMSESAEITDALLTPELVQAAEKAGDLLEYLLITDQPVDKPTTLNETAPRKRIFLRYRVPSDDKYEDLLPLFAYFLRLPDVLVRQAHFRPEVSRKIRVVREEAIAQIRKVEEEAKSEERALEREKAKKAKRDEQLKGMDAKTQKKFLDREREKELKKSQKKGTIRG